MVKGYAQMNACVKLPDAVPTTSIWVPFFTRTGYTITVGSETLFRDDDSPIKLPIIPPISGANKADRRKGGLAASAYQ